MVKGKFVNIFGTNNFVSQDFFHIPDRFGAKWNFSFLMTFFTIKTKTTCPVKNGLEYICIPSRNEKFYLQHIFCIYYNLFGNRMFLFLILFFIKKQNI